MAMGIKSRGIKKKNTWRAKKTSEIGRKKDKEARPHAIASNSCTCPLHFGEKKRENSSTHPSADGDKKKKTHMLYEKRRSAVADQSKPVI